MAACIVCLQEGRGASVCCPKPCPRKVHVACLAKLLDNGFFQCPNCFVEYDAWAVLRAARYAIKQDPGRPQRTVNLAQALRNTGAPAKALRLLSGIAPSCGYVRQMHTIEMAQSYLALGMARAAKDLLMNDLMTAPPSDRLPPGGLLVFLGKACVALGQIEHAEGALHRALHYVSEFPPELAVTTMETIANLMTQKNEPELYAKAHRCICQIVDTEERLGPHTNSERGGTLRVFLL